MMKSLSLIFLLHSCHGQSYWWMGNSANSFGGVEETFVEENNLDVDNQPQSSPELDNAENDFEYTG